MNQSAEKYLAPRIRFNQRKLVLAIAAQIYALSAYAAPTGGEIVGGAGSIEQQGADTTIMQNTDRLAIDWQSFDVGKNERVEFVQPGQSAVALNRILGSKGTEILGRIDANGHVILVNPRGVVFGESATINVGGLIASGLQINPEDFMNGDLVFKRMEGTESTVINSGMINAASGGNVVLLGTQVENSGLISAHLGSVILASGKEAVLTFDESGLLGVHVDEAVLQNELGDKAAITNSGEIRAEGGRILLSASTTRNVFSQAVNWGEQKEARSVTYNEDGSFTLGAGGNLDNSGTINVSGRDGAGTVVVLADHIDHSGAIRADAEQGKAGAIELHSNTTTRISAEGIVSATGKTGGEITLLGKNVGLFDRSKIEAVGEDRGGQVLIGGDREGLNPQVRNAEFVYVDETASVDVSATGNGDGGTAIIYAEDTARIYGEISAKGGLSGGDGGFVETSGKRGFDMRGSPYINAPDGKAGHWLIDPYNIQISENPSNPQVTSSNPFESLETGANLSVDDLLSALENGATVSVKTSKSEGPGEDGNITIAANIEFEKSNATATLNLIAHNNIVFNNNTSITASKDNNSVLNVNLNANTANNNADTKFCEQGCISFGNNTRIETGGGDFKIERIEKNDVNEDSFGAYDVDFSNVVIDVTGPSYEDLGTVNTHFGGRSIDGNRDQHLRSSGRIVVNASHDVNLGGIDPNGSDSHNGDVTMIVRGREQDRMSVDEDTAEKIHIVAGNDIVLNAGRVWTYDNNPTENPRSGSDGSPYDGFTTLKLQAGNDIDLQGDIIYAWNQQAGSGAGQEHNDRLMIDFSAGGNISIDGNILTAGGDFLVREAVNVDFSDQIINTHSRYGAGSVSITATGEVTLGDLPMFAENASGLDANPIRTPSLNISAGTLDLVGNLYTRGGDITLEAALLNLNDRRLETRNGGNIRLATAGDLTLSDIFSAGNITLASKGEAREFTITGTDKRLELNGDLTLNLGKGSADLAGVVNRADGETIHLTIGSGQNVTLQTDQAIRLGNSKLSGDLALTSGSNITQQDDSHLEVGGLSTFSVDEGRIVLDQDNNIFGSFEEDVFTSSAIWIDGENADAVEIASAQDLLLGAADTEMRIGGSLSLNSSKTIAQLGVISVGGATDLSAPSVIFDQENALTSLSIAQAQTAVIRNAQSLQLGDVLDINTLDLSVDGELAQSVDSSLNLETLTLSGNLTARLTQANNQISNLSGDIIGGDIVASGAMDLNDFTIADVTTVSAPDIDIVGQIQLNDEATLTFNDVAIFDFNGGFQGGNAELNSVTVNGDANDGIYTIFDTAIWQGVSIILNGGEGNDTLIGPHSDVDWNLGESSFELETGPEDNFRVLAFSSMETLQGGSGVDEFRFLNGTMPNLTVIGGGGDDIADYSGSLGNISVSLDDIAGLQEIELVRGNNNGESGENNSALVAEGNGEHTWTINAVNSGTVASDDDVTITFEHFNQLQGGAGADHFILQADLKGGNARVDGGAGDDIFDVEVDFTADLIGGAGNDRFNLFAATFGSVLGGFGSDTFVLTENSSVAELDGGDDQDIDILSGFDADLIWTIRGDASIHVGDAAENVYIENATNITGLQGGSGDDSFRFGIADSGVGVDGGEGVNEADFSTVAGNLTVNLGNLNQLGVSNVAEIVGNNAGILGLYNSALVATGTGAADWHLSGTNTGTYNPADGDAITFSGFNQLFGGNGDDNFHLSANVAGAGAIVSGGDGNNQYTFTTDFSADVTGGEGRDQFIVEEGAWLTGLLDGGAGENTLALYDATLTWTIDRANSEAPVRVRVSEELELLPGEILPSIPVPVVAQALNFTGLQAGAGDDTFVYSISDSGVSADGGGGFNTADFSGIEGELEVGLGAEAVFGVTRVSQLIGNGSDSTLRGADQASEWLLDAEGDGQVTWDDQVTLFSGFGHWVGGADEDIFTLHTLSGAPVSIQGGGGADTLDLRAVETDVDLGLGLDGVGGDLNLAEIETVRANSNFSNSLTSSANQVTWTIDGVNSGSLTDDQSFTVNFENFQNLEGLHGNTFRIEDGGELVGGSVTGGTEGENRLIASGSYDQIWFIDEAGHGTLDRNESFSLVFNNLTALVGGGGDDDFVITDADAGIGSIDGGGGNNTLRANFTRNNTLEWLVDDTSRRITGMVGSFQRISRLYGQSGADRFTVNGEVNLELINSGAGDDEILLFGSSHIDRILAGEGSDTIAISNQATVGNAQTPDIKAIDGGEGDDTLALTGYSSAVIWNSVDGRVTVSGSNTVFEYLSIESFKAPTGQGLVNTFQAPDGNNTWTITGVNSGRLKTEDGQVVTYEAIANLLGGSLEDVFVLDGGSVTGEVDGGAGNNTLQGSDSGYQWTIDGTDAGRITNASGQIAAFENIQTLIGGAGADQFEIAAGGRLTGGINAGAGSDTLTSRRDRQVWQITGDDSGVIEDSEVELLSFIGIESITGSNTDILRGDDSNRLWLLSGVGAGSIESMTFSGFRDLIGGAGADSFVVTQEGSIDGAIDGGGGNNDLVIQKQNAVSVNLDPERQMEGAFNVRSLQTVKVENSAVNNLYGAGGDDTEYLWIVDGKDTGFVGEEAESGVNFINFANLFGGSGSDNFQIGTSGALAGIDGGGGSDYLDYSEYVGNLTVTIGKNLGQDANFTINSVEGVRGNDDGLGSRWTATLQARDGTNVWTLTGDGEPGQDGINDGIFEQSGGDRIVFRNFSYLQGGSSNDTFVLKDQGMLTGSIRDNGGNNRLDLKETSRNLRTVIFTTDELPRTRRENELFVQGLQTLEGKGVSTTLVGPGVSTQWTINNRDSGELSYHDHRVTFTGFGNVSGGGSTDVFTVHTAGAMSGWFAGGDGAAVDEIRFIGESPVSVWLATGEPTEGTWHWLNGGFDVVTARANTQNLLASQSSGAQEWNITGTNAGSVADAGNEKALSFEGFGGVRGGEGDDEFIFSSGGSLTGLLDGGGGDNAVNLQALASPISVAIGNQEGANLRIERIVQITANEASAANNWLWGADQDNQWSISDVNAGDLNSLQFSGFANLRGGAADDQFKFQQLGKLSGQIDGGAHNQGDVVDYGSVIDDTLSVDLTAARLHNVEQLVGNGSTTLHGPNQRANWRITEGNNQGQLSYGIDQVLDFTGVHRLVGGSDSDEFMFSGGAVITAGVDGGGGADRFFVDVGGNGTASTWLTGGAGEDMLEFRGGGDGWRGTYGPNSDGAPRFTFSAPNSNSRSLAVGYSGMESVLVRSSLDRMTLTGGAEADEFRLGSQSWQWGNLTAVSYREAVRGLEVSGDSADTIVISGHVKLVHELLLNGGTVGAEGGALLETGTLALNGLQSAGSTESPLNISVDTLTLTDNLGALHLREADGLTLDGLTGKAAVDLHLREGDLTQSDETNNTINSSGDLRFSAQSGAIRLDRSDNQIGGTIALEAGTEAIVHANGDLVLAGAKARDLRLETTGDITSDIAVEVTNAAHLHSGGDINLSADSNALNQVFIDAVGDVQLLNQRLLLLMDTEVGGHLHAGASGIQFNGEIVTDTLTAEAGATGLAVSGSVTTNGDAVFTTAGSLLMLSEGHIHSVAGNIDVTTEGTQLLRLLTADEGEIFLRSGDSIADFNDAGGTALNIKANAFRARAARGIGATDPLELEVGMVDLVNQEGAVSVANYAPLVIERIHNGGDISLWNSTDVTFMKESVNAFYGTEEPLYPENKENPGFGHNFTLSLTGNIKTDGSLVIDQPHIAARSVVITNPFGVFLPPSPVIYAPYEITIRSGRSRNRPPWGFGVVPDDINDDTKYYGDVVGAGEQLIEVESLAEIDPAIFTQVKNYFYQDVSIRLPSDQLYEEEEEL